VLPAHYVLPEELVIDVAVVIVFHEIAINIGQVIGKLLCQLTFLLKNIISRSDNVIVKMDGFQFIDNLEKFKDFLPDFGFVPVADE
jgi:hypothetical protein